MLIDYIFILIIIALLIEKGYSYIKRRKNPINYVASFKESLDLCSLPVITFNNDTLGKINLLIDTGATKSVINYSTVASYIEEISLSNNSVIGSGGTTNTYNKSISTKLSIKDINFNIEFMIVDMDATFSQIKENKGVTIHGIIGNDFLENHKYIIDYSDYKIYDRK